jgi:hypothetical protein
MLVLQVGNTQYFKGAPQAPLNACQAGGFLPHQLST